MGRRSECRSAGTSGARRRSLLRGGIERNDLGATHLAFFVEDFDKFYADTSQRGLRFLSPPVEMRDDNGTLQRKVAYSQDPDGNWLEFIEAF